jgi:hypothetical protein
MQVGSTLARVSRARLSRAMRAYRPGRTYGLVACCSSSSYSHVGTKNACAKTTLST